MKIVKEIITKKYRDADILIETVKQFHYDSATEKASHLMEMEAEGFNDSGQVKENVGTVFNPVYTWFGSYYKVEVVARPV